MGKFVCGKNFTEDMSLFEHLRTPNTPSPLEADKLGEMTCSPSETDIQKGCENLLENDCFAFVLPPGETRIVRRPGLFTNDVDWKNDSAVYWFQSKNKWEQKQDVPQKQGSGVQAVLKKSKHEGPKENDIVFKRTTYTLKMKKENDDGKWVPTGIKVWEIETVTWPPTKASRSPVQESYEAAVSVKLSIFVFVKVGSALLFKDALKRLCVSTYDEEWNLWKHPRLGE